MDRKTFPTLAPPSEDPLQSGGQEEDRAGLQEVSWRFRALNPGDDLIHLSHLNFLTASSRKPSLLTSRPSCFFPPLSSCGTTYFLKLSSCLIELSPTSLLESVFP